LRLSIPQYKKLSMELNIPEEYLQNKDINFDELVKIITNDLGNELLLKNGLSCVLGCSPSMRNRIVKRLFENRQAEKIKQLLNVFLLGAESNVDKILSGNYDHLILELNLEEMDELLNNAELNQVNLSEKIRGLYPLPINDCTVIPLLSASTKLKMEELQNPCIDYIEYEKGIELCYDESGEIDMVWAGENAAKDIFTSETLSWFLENASTLLNHTTCFTVYGCSGRLAVPESICQLTSLQALRIKDTIIESLPEDLGNLQRLRILGIDLSRSGSEVTLPDGIASLEPLEYLGIKNLGENKKLPSFDKLKKLKELSLIDCKGISHLPEEIYHLKQLKLLNLKGCKSLEYLSENLSNLKNLCELDLRDCKNLGKLPVTFCPRKIFRLETCMKFIGGAKSTTSFSNDEHFRISLHKLFSNNPFYWTPPNTMKFSEEEKLEQERLTNIISGYPPEECSNVINFMFSPLEWYSQMKEKGQLNSFHKVLSHKFANCEEYKPEVFENLFNDLLNYHDPQRKEDFAKFFVEEFLLSKDETKLQKSILLLNHANKLKNRRIPGMLLSSFVVLDDEDRVQVQLLDNICISTKISKDATWVRSINRGLFALASCKELSPEQKTEIITKVTTLSGNIYENKKVLEIRMNVMTSIIGLELGHEISENVDFNHISEILDSYLINNFDLDIDNLPSKYAATLGKWRNLPAVFSYLESLKSQGNKDYIDIYESFIKSVIDGQFKENRYSLESNIHLREVFTNRAELFQEWKKEETIKVKDLENDLFLCSMSEYESVFDLFRDKIINSSCIGKDWAERYPQLFEVFCENANLNEKITVLKNMLQKNPGEKDVQLQLRILQFCSRGNINILTDEEIDLIRSELNIINELVNNSAFNEAFSTLLTPLGGLEHHSELEVVDTDNPNDLLLSGTEIPGSCQHIENSIHNIGLLAPILNGQIRLVAIKNSQGKIRGRRFLKILIDENNVPALYQSAYYGYLETLDRVINAMSMRRARAMQLPLYRWRRELSKLPIGGLRSMGGPAPYEYVDAHQIGLVLNGEYTIMRKKSDSIYDDNSRKAGA
jgi:hypothetical protein